MAVSEKDAIALALSLGGELEVDGRKINSARQVYDLKPKKPDPKFDPSATVPAPVAAEPALTMADVQRLLADQEARFSQQLKELAVTLLNFQQPQAVGAPSPWEFSVEYSKDGSIDRILAVPSAPRLNA